MSELDTTVKDLMEKLRKLDSLLEEGGLENTNDLGESIYTGLYRKLTSELYVPDTQGHGMKIAIIPGRDRVPCLETLLVCLFPVYNDLGESFPDNLIELRFMQAKQFIESCPDTRNVVFYGPVWNSVLWKFHKPYFAARNVYLKPFFVVYTSVRK